MPWKHPSEEVQKEFIEEYEILLSDAKKWTLHILFYDPVHQIHNSVAWKCRIEKGKEHQLKSNTWRKRITALWWINPINLKFSGLITKDNCDTEMTKATFKIIREDYPDDKPIFLFLDNAAYNRAYESQEYAESLGITLFFIPPYSPNLNLVERLRKFMKKKLVKNRYFEVFDDFYTAFIGFFTELETRFNELKSIFDNKFQILKAV